MTDGENAGENTIPANSGVLPHLMIPDGKAAEAIDFYAAAFGATEVERSPGPGGKLYHVRLECNGGPLLLHDDFPEMRDGAPAPQTAGVVLHLQVEDVDAAWEKATTAGCGVRFPLTDQFWGDRYGQLTDPYGHTWSLAAPIKG